MVKAERHLRSTAIFGLMFFLFGVPLPAPGADVLDWRQEQNLVSADVTSWDLYQLLENIATVTGWQVFVEPESKLAVSTKFKDRPPGDALRLLLGNLSFALLPAREGATASRLYVFKTSMQDATKLVRPAVKKADPTAKPIPNELIVTLKPGAKIDELAKKLGAKVIGRADGLNAYRLQFESAEATEAARAQLRDNPDVEAIDNNYFMRRPEPLDALTYSSASPLNLQPKAAGDCNHPIIGLIDSAVQPPGGTLNDFLLPAISVAGEAKLSESQPSHGTSMFETILRGLSFAGKDSPAKILPVDVYGSNPVTSTFDVANGVAQAIKGGANTINLSLGSSGDSQFLHNVIKSASEQGILFFAAAGNEPGTAPSYPAAYPEVMAVTAGTRDGSIAPYANRGDFVDLAAPGSSMVFFNGQSFLVMGTSASTAYASGLAASMIDCNNRSAAQISAAMQALLPVKR
jgi:hypothetical protein